MYVFDMYISIALMFGVTAAAVALNTGRNAVLWFSVGLLAGPLSLVVILLPPASSTAARAARQRNRAAAHRRSADS